MSIAPVSSAFTARPVAAASAPQPGASAPAAAPSMGQDGFKRSSPIKKTLNGAGDVALGVGDAVVEEGKGLASMVTHPGRAVKGIARLVTHPKSTIEALGRDEDGDRGPERSKARQIGKVVGKVGLGIATSGAGTAVNVAKTSADAAKKADRVAQAGRDGRDTPDTGRLDAGDALKGAARYTFQPVGDTVHAVTHPGSTIKGLSGAARHPMQAAKGTQDQPVERSSSQNFGVGVVRLGAMTIGADGLLETTKHVANAGSKVDSIARANP